MNSIPSISTTIKKVYFDEKLKDLVDDGFFFEYKEEKPFWTKRINTLLKKIDLRLYGILGIKPDIVFLVGNKPYRFKVENILYMKTQDVPEKYRYAIITDFVWVIKCIENKPEVPE